MQVCGDRITEWMSGGKQFVTKALSRGSLLKYEGSEQDVSVCALVNIKCFDVSKIDYFL